MEKLFDAGHVVRNGESRMLNPYSNGIGLSFCKQVCQSLEGDISVSSILGVGSVFTFTMKVMKAYVHESESDSEDIYSCSGPKNDQTDPA